MPENEFDAAGHDSGILGLSKQERRGKVCNDGTMGKLKDRQVGTLRVITSTFSATPGFTPFKPTMDADDKSQESPYKSANAPASIKKIKPTSAEMARFKEKTRRRESGYQPPRLNKSEAEGYQDNSLFKYSLNEQLNQVQLAGDIVEDVEVQAPKAKNAGFKRF